MLTTLPRPKFAAKQPIPPDTVIGVIGAGTMGAGIAEVAACGGHPVKIFDSIPEAVTRALEKVNRSLTKSVGKGRLTPGTAAEIERRIAPVTSLFGLSDAGFVIEAVVEDLDTKKHLMQDLENILSNESIIATNTSSFSITKLAAGLVYPNRVIGMHFFNPAQIMELVEVIPGLATDSATLSIVLETTTAWNKIPVRTKSTPGFIVNRVARPFYAEALRLATEGSDPATIDYVMREAGQFPMGPFELMDAIGAKDPNAVVLSEAALIFEAGGGKRFDKIIVVTCKQDQKAARLARRMGIDQAAAQVEVERRMKAQIPDEEKARRADYVIDNSGSLEETRRQVERVFRELKAL